MSALLGIGWLLWLALALVLVFDALGMVGLVRMFPEGRRWWQLPLQLASLAHFAAVVRFTPWG